MVKGKGKGYRPSERSGRRSASIEFAPEHEFHGAEATVALTATMDFLLSVEGLDDASPVRKREIMAAFGDSVLIDWNVEERDGKPVPANGDGFLAQDLDFGIAIMRAWAEVMTAPGLPLSPPSNGRASSEGVGGSSGATATGTRLTRRGR